MRKLVIWQDYQGLNRAYAVGPAEHLEEIRKIARKHLELYCAKKRKLGDEPMMCDPKYFSEKIQDIE